MKSLAPVCLLLLAGCQATPPGAKPGAHEARSRGPVRTRPRPARSRAPSPKPRAARLKKKIPTVRIRGPKGTAARRAQAPRVASARTPREALAAAERTLSAGNYREAAHAADTLLLRKPPSLALRLRAQVVLARSRIGLGERERGVKVMDRALSTAHEEGASPIQIATLNFWRGRALAEAGRVLEALSDLDAVDEAFDLAQWFAARFRLDGVTGLERQVQPTPLLRARVLALRCWLRRVMIREGRLGATPEGLLDQAEACRLAPRDSLARQLLTRQPERPSPCPRLRRWRLAPLPSRARLRWLAGRLRVRAQPSLVKAGIEGYEAWVDAEHKRLQRVLRAAWREPEHSRGLVAISRALVLLGPEIEDRRQAAALLVRRARIFRLLGEEAQAKLDEERGRGVLAASLGPTRHKALRLESDLARLAFWGGDFELARRSAERGWSSYAGGQDYELQEIQGQVWACHALSLYISTVDKPKATRDQVLTWIATELWIAERCLGEVEFGRWLVYAEGEARLRFSGSGEFPCAPSREPDWPPGGGSCGSAGGTHQGPGPCRGAACKPSLQSRLLGFARR